MLDSQAEGLGSRESLVDMYLTMIPIGRLAQAKEVANAAVFLASDQSSYKTGTDLTADGGVGQIWKGTLLRRGGEDDGSDEY